jgi:protein-S-isoprenylcysteine O-methyltransferase Ste14
MTRDAKESLTALGAVLAAVCLGFLFLLLIPEDMELPRWMWWAGFGLNTAILVVHILRRRRRPAERPE